MDRNEAVLRELNLYPQWIQRSQPVPEEPQSVRAELVEACPKPTEIGVLCPSTTPLVLSEVEGAGRTEINNIHADSSVVAPAFQADNPGWPELKQQVRDCTACKLRAGCTQTVFGTGDEKAEWLFVGEGPGADEDAQGEPFVGQAGKLLDNMLLAIKLRRGKNVYIANVVKCRPPGNRTPDADEIATCLPYLQRQIELIKPKLIVALGKTAATALLGRDAPLGSLRGTLHDYRAPVTDLSSAQGCESSHQPLLPHQTTLSHRVGTATPLLVTYHPAYLLRSPMEKAKTWQDLCLAVNTMAGLGD